MQINRQAFSMLGLGVVIALSMMRVPPPLYITPIYLFALLALLDSDSRNNLVRLTGKLPVLLSYFVFAVLSIAWAEFPSLVLKN